MAPSSRLKPQAFWYVALVFLLFPSCATSPQSGRVDMEKITGQVSFRERMMLPPNAVVTVMLEDVARMDVKADLISSTRFAAEGGPPWNFTLKYDPGKIKDKGRYGLRAKIEAGGRLMFTSTEHIPAFGAPAGEPVNIMLHRVSGKKALQSDLSQAELTDTYWKLTEIDGEPAMLGADEKEVHLVLVSETSRVKGFSGCNSFTGAFTARDGHLAFSQMASTMRACVSGMDQEQQFLRALENTAQYDLAGETLELRGEDGGALLRFAAVYLN